MNETYAQQNPYAAPAAFVADDAPREQLLADRGVRLAAALLDGLFVGFSVLPMAIAFVWALDANGQPQFRAGQVLALGLGGLLVLALLAWNCVLLQRNGQTVAKKMLGIRGVRRDGSHCGLARIFFARYLPVTVLSVIPFIGSLVSLVDALLIFRDDRRCLHDEIADTIVVTA